MVSKVVSISLICEGSTLSMYELHPFWLAKGTKNVCDNVFNDYVASLEPSRAEIFRKAWYCGSPVGTAFLKHLEQPYAQQLTTMVLSILYHG